LIGKERTVRLTLILIFYFRYDFSENTHDVNCQYITNLPILESERVDEWIDEMDELAERPNHMYGIFDKLRFRPLIGINIVRDFIQDMWVKVSNIR
jgi:hypothetical protein